MSLQKRRINKEQKLKSEFKIEKSKTYDRKNSFDHLLLDKK